MAYRLGIDIGGTFTDVALFDEAKQEFYISKVPTTPRDFTIAFEEAFKRVVESADAKTGEIIYLIHGTTFVTNTIIERKTAKTGLITTEGFRDILEIGTAARHGNIYDINIEKPPLIVPRRFRFTVPERINFKGTVLTELKEEKVRTVARRLRGLGIEAVAICLLHSYINSRHEERVCEVVEDEAPSMYISLSSKVCPEFREYYRASTTAVNACMLPLIDRYLEGWDKQLRELGVSSELHIMNSAGGVMTMDAARSLPVRIVESGPAAGVIAAAHIGRLCGCQNVISFDMGGTTAKSGVIIQGKPIVTTEYEIGGSVHYGHLLRGSGYPIKVPVMDLSEVGAGGGSIAWLDIGGALRVGPQSAGAEPGPVCYGAGGSEPTITDADLVLGVINPDYFLGGEMKLDTKAAWRAVKDKIADPMGIGVTEASLGIIEVAIANMVRMIKIVTIERGFDPRDFVLLAFGGAGPMHAVRIAEELGITRIVVPEFPGITSALGLLLTDVRYDYVKVFPRGADGTELSRINEAYKELEAEGAARLKGNNFQDSNIMLTRRADVRYMGQSYVVPVHVPSGDLTEGDIATIYERFHNAHEKMYGHSARREPTEIVNLRVTATGLIPHVKLKEYIDSHKEVPKKALTGVRDAFFRGDLIRCPIYRREKLLSGNIFDGPAIVEQGDSTTVVPEGYHVRVDRFRNMRIETSSN